MITTIFPDIYSTGGLFIARLNVEFCGKTIRFKNGVIGFTVKPISFYAIDFKQDTEAVNIYGKYSGDFKDYNKSEYHRQIFCEFYEGENLQSLNLVKIHPDDILSFCKYDEHPGKYGILNKQGLELLTFTI